MNYNDLVRMLVKNPEQIKNEVTSKDLAIIHMILGVSGEAGELLDAIKKSVIYRKQLNRENVIEELGDIEFYLEGLRQELGIVRQECIDANIAKLLKRYKNLSYSDNSAIIRADKEQ